MRKTSRAFYVLPLTALALLCAAEAAQAQTIGWVDRMFTFRENQKPNLRPNRRTVPNAVYQPYYDQDGHEAWSTFYTRTDLEPTDYLSSSASKVMRPAGGGTHGSADDVPGGWDTINARAHANMAASAPNIAIGEPGEGHGMLTGDSSVGKQTRIGPAVRDWRDSSGGNGLASRPGDYDYRMPDVTRPPLEDNGIIRSEDVRAAAAPAARNSAAAAVPPENNPYRHDKRYLEFNDAGQVVRYEVQKGDTLSDISGQPAIYGKKAMWPLIYSANKTAIGGKPSNLKVKQELVIPRDYTEEQAREAEKRSR